MNKLQLTIVSSAIWLVFSTGAMAATMSDKEYEAAEDSIEARYEADKAACDSKSGNAKDICVEEAKGRQKVAEAELEAKHNPTAKNRYDARIAEADAAYAVAKEKCDDASGDAKDVCQKEAKMAHATAKADAEVEAKAEKGDTTQR